MESSVNILFILFIFVFAFVLGMRWDSHNINHALTEKGYAISRDGDNSRYKITGTVEDI